jgi:ribonuclease HI
MKIWIDGSKTELCWVAEGQPHFIPAHPEDTTNGNEYWALIHALRWAIIKEFEYLEIYSDSQLMVRQVQGTYKCENKRLDELLRYVQESLVSNKIKNFTLTWIPREQNLAGIELERRAKAWKKKNI